MKQRVRADIAVDRRLLELLDAADNIDGVRSVGFFADLAGTMRSQNGVLWLIYEHDGAAAFEKLHDLLVKNTNGAISLKSAGVRLEPGDEGYKPPR